MIDIRSQLTRSTKIKQVNRSVTKALTIHWNGPATGPSDLQQIKGDANFHVNTRGWDGLAYHYAIGKDGTVYQCRDYMARLNHSGVPQGNSESLSVLVVTGEGQSIPPAQFKALEELIVTLKAQPRWVLSHQEWPRLTACPGPLLSRWLYNTFRPRYTATGEAFTTAVANIRDEASVLSHLQRQLGVGTKVSGTWVLGKPFKGDSLWLKVGEDYIHGSILKGNIPSWALQTF